MSMVYRRGPSTGLKVLSSGAYSFLNCYESWTSHLCFFAKFLQLRGSEMIMMIIVHLSCEIQMRKCVGEYLEKGKSPCGGSVCYYVTLKYLYQTPTLGKALWWAP